jgi:hypothetical protein
MRRHPTLWSLTLSHPPYPPRRPCLLSYPRFQVLLLLHLALQMQQRLWKAALHRQRQAPQQARRLHRVAKRRTSIGGTGLLTRRTGSKSGWMILCTSITLWMMGRVKKLQSNVFEYFWDRFRVILFLAPYMYTLESVCNNDTHFLDHYRLFACACCARVADAQTLSASWGR